MRLLSVPCGSFWLNGFFGAVTGGPTLQEWRRTMGWIERHCALFALGAKLLASGRGRTGEQEEGRGGLRCCSVALNGFPLRLEAHSWGGLLSRAGANWLTEWLEDCEEATAIRPALIEFDASLNSFQMEEQVLFSSNPNAGVCVCVCTCVRSHSEGERAHNALTLRCC